eukprot:COSAG03_NODE_6258_length_1088_cov_4594.301314_3_plen_160_part_01
MTPTIICAPLSLSLSLSLSLCRRGPAEALLRSPPAAGRLHAVSATEASGCADLSFSASLRCARATDGSVGILESLPAWLLHACCSDVLLCFRAKHSMLKCDTPRARVTYHPSIPGKPKCLDPKKIQKKFEQSCPKPIVFGSSSRFGGCSTEFSHADTSFC